MSKNQSDLVEILKSSWPYLVAVIGFILTAIGLIINYRNRRDQSKSKHIDKQIERVFSLIKDIHSSKCEILFNVSDGEGGSSATGSAIRFNLFEIAKYDEFASPKANQHFNDDAVLFEKNSNQIMNIKIYLNDPLMPREIVEKLHPLYNSSFNNIIMPNDTQNLRHYVTINSGVWEEKELLISKEKGRLIEGNGLAFITWENLKKHCKALKDSIENWLNKNGVKDYNINDEFIESSF